MAHVDRPCGNGTDFSESPTNTAHKQDPDESEDDVELFITVDDRELQDDQNRTSKTKPSAKKKKDHEAMKGEEPTCDFDETLDQALEDQAKQHNLTAVNVRNILHEVITNEHVVAMMKAAITDTEDMPLFEPKMTRSKLKEVVEKGVVIPAWNLSPIKKPGEVKTPQFVDIPLEEDDSSDEEYQPEEGEEDETAEESLLESDVESTASSPHGRKLSKLHRLEPPGVEEELSADGQENSNICGFIKHISADVVPMGPPPPPKERPLQDSTFMEKLHAVDEELAFSPVCMDTYQSLNDSLIACRTRSKRPLKGIPIGKLEAELQAPDITPDMYEQNTADDEDWKWWLRGLMEDDVCNEEGDDEDDPEYNFLEDIDEPDTEDLRNDRAVRITKKEVSKLMEELFETFQDEMGFSHMEEQGPQDEDSNQEGLPDFNTPQALKFDEPLVNLLNEQHRTVRAQIECLRMRKSLMKASIQSTEDIKPSFTQAAEEPRAPPLPKVAPVMSLDAAQRRRLQQQMQQHVQLLTQVHLLSSQIPLLSQQADTARMFLMELCSFAEKSTMCHRLSNPEFQTMFETRNLGEALQLLSEFHGQIPQFEDESKPLKKNVHEFQSLPRQVAWIMATRPLFMYPELLPGCALKAKGPRDRVFFTKAEDNLLALGLKHFEGTDYYKPLISKYLVTAKTAHQLTIRIKNLTMKKTPDNIIKFYKQTKALPIMFKCCDDVPPQDARAPIEREKHRLPFWLKSNLGNIEAALEKTKMDARESDANNLRSPYPLIIPPDLVLDLKPMPSRFPRKAWRQKRPSILKPLLIRPTSSSNTNSLPKTMTKMPLSEPFPIGLYARLPNLIPMQNVMGIQPVDIPEQLSSQVMVAPVPITPAKVIQPSILTQKARKPLLCGVSRRRTLAGTPAFKSAPLIHPAPVIFAVPSTSVKLVSLGSACGVIQPVNTGTGVPISTVLLNPASLPLTPNVVSSPMMEPYRAEHKTLVTKHHVQDAEPLEDEQDCVSIAVKVEVAERLRVDNEPPRIVASNCEIKKCGKFSPDQGESIGSCNIHVFQVPKSPDVQRLDIGSDSVKTEPQEGQHVISHQGPDTKGEQVPVGEPTTLESVLPAFQDQLRPQGLGQLDLTLVKEPMKEEDENVSNPSLAQMEDPVEIAGSEEAPGGEQRFAEEEAQYHDTADPGESPKNTSSSTDGDVDVNSPVGTHPDSSSPSGRLESGNDKDGPEEEEEEDFDDLTQDEDEEEMSSASEESVLSVPELQETMEKLTWLASERRLSQEGDSEENSQEENSEQEEEEEEEGEEGIERSAQKEKEMTDEVTEGRTETAPSNLCDPVPAPVETSTAPTGERRRGGSRGPGSHRVRNRRGRTRTNKDASKLLLLYDENILAKDPLREQKDMAFAQSYLNRVREALQFAPGKYEEFLRLIYQFETKRWERTAMDLYDKLRELLKDWPQLLKDFAAFLLPEQALECGLFEEQQAFDKSRKFLRQLEICFMENTAQYQKIIKLLQSCAECPLQEINKLKSQMWQLLKGHNHLQDEFSLFFDQLRPPASRLGEFEVVNWTEDKGYKFDGFEEVTLPDLEEDEEQTKALAPRSKRKKEITQGQEKETDWPDGGKDCPCSCHESGAEQRLKRCKRRMCSHCSTKTCERVQRTRDPPDPPHRSFRLVPAVKEGGPEEELSPRHSDERLPAGNGPEGSGGIKEADRPQSTAHNREGTLIKLRLSTRDSARPTAPNRTGRKSGTGKGLDQASEKETDGLSATVPGATKDSLAITPRPSPGHSDPIHIKQDLSKTELPSDREQILTVCAKNITVGSSGEKVILWTREADRVILTMCQERGAQEETFAAISVQLGNKSPEQVSQRFQELVKLFQTAACVTSSDEEEAGSTTDQLSDQEMDNED